MTISLSVGVDQSPFARLVIHVAMVWLQTWSFWQEHRDIHSNEFKLTGRIDHVAHNCHAKNSSHRDTREKRLKLFCAKQPSIAILAMFVTILSPLFCVSESTRKVSLKSHCFRCHGAQAQKSDCRFDALHGKITFLSTLKIYQEIVDRLNLNATHPRARLSQRPESGWRCSF